MIANKTTFNTNQFALGVATGIGCTLAYQAIKTLFAARISEQATQTTEPIVVSAQRPGETFTVTLRSTNLSIQQLHRSKAVSESEIQTTSIERATTGTMTDDDKRFFYCCMEDGFVEFPQPIPLEYLIQIEENKFSFWNLIPSLLSMDEPINPFTKNKLTDAILKQLSQECGLTPAAFKEIWTDVRERVTEEPRNNPDLLEQRTDNRFRNLYAILSNPSSQKTKKQREKCLELLQNSESWKTKFPKKK